MATWSSLISYFFIICIKCQIEDDDEAAHELLEHEFPHYQFSCEPNGYSYETEFTFLRGLGRGFVHAEAYQLIRIMNVTVLNSIILQSTGIIGHIGLIISTLFDQYGSYLIHVISAITHFVAQFLFIRSILPW